MPVMFMMSIHKIQLLNVFFRSFVGMSNGFMNEYLFYYLWISAFLYIASDVADESLIHELLIQHYEIHDSEAIFQLCVSTVSSILFVFSVRIGQTATFDVKQIPKWHFQKHL